MAVERKSNRYIIVGEQIQQVSCVMKFAQLSFLYIICVLQ